MTDPTTNLGTNPVTNPMTQLVLQRETMIDAPVAHVWQLVATESGLRQWWGNAISLEAKEGGRCEEWRLEKDQTSHWQGVVTLYSPPHQLMLSLRAQESLGGRPELTTIEIALKAQGEQTHVQVTQRAFALTSAASSAPRLGTPGQPQLSPRAQLDRVPPGSLPAPTQIAASGHIDPAVLLVTHAESDELTLRWQRRLTSLAAASSGASGS